MTYYIDKVKTSEEIKKEILDKLTLTEKEVRLIESKDSIGVDRMFYFQATEGQPMILKERPWTKEEEIVLSTVKRTVKFEEIQI